MEYWLNIHDPIPTNLRIGTDDYDCYHSYLWLQEKHNKTKLPIIKKGDIAVIYETEGPGKREAVNGQNRATITLRQGRKGIVSVIRIADDFQYDEHYWDGIHFIGYFRGQRVETRRHFVPLGELREAWMRAGLPSFNPRINGGLRELKAEEWQTVSTLMGCTD